jgi:hypothetical protein
MVFYHIQCRAGTGSVSETTSSSWFRVVIGVLAREGKLFPVVGRLWIQKGFRAPVSMMVRQGEVLYDLSPQFALVL